MVTKAWWEELRDEYLAYRTQLLSIVHEEERKSGAGVQSRPGAAGPTLPPSLLNVPHSTVIRDYPSGCLVFAGVSFVGRLTRRTKRVGLGDAALSSGGQGVSSGWGG